MLTRLDQPSVISRVRLYLGTARRSAHRYGIHPSGVLGHINPRPVFIVGCPRSGTTFTAAALGGLPGFADLGEVKRLKAGLPGLYRAAQEGRPEATVAALRAIFSRSQRMAMAAAKRGIEQTPESTFVIAQIAQAFPQAHFVHLVRDGRDVVTSLIEQGWLAGQPNELVAARMGHETVDDAGHPFGGYARFWVEDGREREFESATEARRCAWAWRRYVTAARSALEQLDANRVTTVRYEQLTFEPAQTAARVADELNAKATAEDLTRAFSAAHARSVGRHAQMLGPDAVAEVIAEAGPLLEELGYLSSDC